MYQWWTAALLTPKTTDEISGVSIPTSKRRARRDGLQERGGASKKGKIQRKSEE